MWELPAPFLRMWAKFQTRDTVGNISGVLEVEWCRAKASLFILLPLSSLNGILCWTPPTFLILEVALWKLHPFIVIFFHFQNCFQISAKSSKKIIKKKLKTLSKFPITKFLIMPYILDINYNISKKPICLSGISLWTKCNL